MGCDARLRQKALARKAAKRKARRRGHCGASAYSARVLPRGVETWPLFEVVVSSHWNDGDHLAEVTAARRSPLGQIALGVFLVDLQCLGVKNAIAHVFPALADYQMFRCRQSPAGPVELNLAAKIIREGVAYGAQFGFNPHPDYHQAKAVLAGADPEACSVPVPLGGPEGKPFFVAGPNDDVAAILDRLTATLGADGFHYLVAVCDGVSSESWNECAEDPEGEFFDEDFLEVEDES